MEEYTFDAELYAWEARPESWVFVTLPTDVSDTIDDTLTTPPRGFGSVRVHARCGSTSWDTSIFPSKEEGSYVLPVTSTSHVGSPRPCQQGPTPLTTSCGRR